MSNLRIDVDGDHWSTDGDGWTCVEYPENWMHSLEALDRIFGPLTDPYEED